MSVKGVRNANATGVYRLAVIQMRWIDHAFLCLRLKLLLYTIAVSCLNFLC